MKRYVLVFVAKVISKRRELTTLLASFSPTASQVSIRLVYAITALPGWRTIDLDASAAFISATLPPNEYSYI